MPLCCDPRATEKSGCFRVKTNSFLSGPILAWSLLGFSYLGHCSLKCSKTFSAIHNSWSAWPVFWTQGRELGLKTSLWAARGAEQEVDRFVDVYLAVRRLGPVMAHSRYSLKVSWVVQRPGYECSGIW